MSTTPGFGANDEEPVDLAAVAADDAALERVRHGQPAPDDPALSLLHDLRLDVESDLPQIVPVGRGTTVLVLAGQDAPDRRLARSGTLAAALTAGVLALGGVAAASTLAPAGTPLHGVGEAVRSAAGAVVAAVTPPETARRATTALPLPSASPTAQATRAAAPPPRATTGAAVPAVVRSRAAARQVDQLLDAAQALLDDGRTSAARDRLDVAQRRLGEVLPADVGDLRSRLDALRARASAPVVAPVQPRATKAPAPAKADPPGRGKAGRPAKEQPTRAPAGDSTPRGSTRSAPAKGPGEDRPLADLSSTRDAPARADGEDRPPADQSSIRDASANPRA